MKKRLSLLLIQSIFLMLTACGGGGGDGGASLTPSDSNSSDDGEPSLTPSDSNNQTVSRGDLVSSELLATKSGTFFIPYSVNAYKITYNTVDVDGNAIEASGLLAVPNKDSAEKSPLISYQHATIFLDTQAPSNSSTSANGIMTLAGAGYIVSAADYIGYGESADKIHPYIHADSLASASIDMLQASKAFLQSKGFITNTQLFLAGYSEGGYATLALQKAIQEDSASGFTVTASAAGAGPFDLSETAKKIANQTSNPDPSYMSFLLKAYDSTYHLNQVSEMYQSQYVNTINSVFNGQNSGGSIDNRLTETTADLFNAPFLNALQGNGAHVIKDKLALNNIYDWKPTAPTRLFHGPNDEIVPYSNAQKALTTMTENGATNVRLVDCVLNSHADCAIPYVLDTLSFFVIYANDL